MNVAQLSPTFYTAYFGALHAAMKQSMTLGDVTRLLYDASARRDGRQSLQFSFATKLLHMTNPVLPIFDSQIACFFFFQEASTGVNLQQRIDGFLAFHDFLIQEYERVLRCGLLAKTIQEYRRQLQPQRVTDEKIVDSIIWAFVGLLRKGGIAEATGHLPLTSSNVLRLMDAVFLSDIGTEWTPRRLSPKLIALSASSHSRTPDR